MTDRPTREEHAAALEHDPRRCHICCSPRHGDQAPDPLELENDRLRAGIEGINATLDATIAAFAKEREAFNRQVATLTARVENAEAGSVVVKECIARLVAERDAARAEEREACAKVGEDLAKKWREEGYGDERHEFAGHGIDELVAAIRARGVKP